MLTQSQHYRGLSTGQQHLGARKEQLVRQSHGLSKTNARGLEFVSQWHSHSVGQQGADAVKSGKAVAGEDAEQSSGNKEQIVCADCGNRKNAKKDRTESEEANVL